MPSNDLNYDNSHRNRSKDDKSRVTAARTSYRASTRLPVRRRVEAIEEGSEFGALFVFRTVGAGQGIRAAAMRIFEHH